MICGILASDVASQGMHTPKYPTRGSTVSLQSENVKYETKNSKGKSHPVYTPKSDTHSGEQYDSTDFEFFEDSNECSCYGRISEIPDEGPMQKFFKCDGEGFQSITGSSIYSVYYELNGDFTQHDADMYQQSSLQEYFEINEEGTLYAYRQDPYISVSVPDSDPKSHVSCTTEIESGDVWFALSLSLLAGLANAGILPSNTSLLYSYPFSFLSILPSWCTSSFTSTFCPSFCLHDDVLLYFLTSFTSFLQSEESPYFSFKRHKMSLVE
jgi:hypothetical protein